MDNTPIIKAEDKLRMKALGFTAVVFINRDISVRKVGSVEACFRSLGDAKKFATLLNKVYGCRDGYKGASI